MHVSRRPLQDQMRLAGFAAQRAARSLRLGLGVPARIAAMTSLRRATRVLIAPQDIRTADPIIAQDIYGGYFAFGGKAIQLRGQSPFEVDPPSASWSRNLMGFGWLRHLRAANTPLARANAIAMTSDWLNFADRRFPAAAGRVVHEPGVAARRILSWLSQSPIILDEATLPFYTRFVGSVTQQARRLQVALAEGLTGETRLLAMIALAQTSLCIEGLEGLQRKHARQLAKELHIQVLADGGHVSRNPGLIGELLVDLLPLRQAYAARSVEIPPALAGAIDRMMPMLRMLRHGNGELALFNGMGATAPDLLATVLAYDDGRGAMASAAPQSGYHRLQAGGAVLILDSGRLPQARHARRAHAGCLSFEFSSGLNRIVVNCGATAGEASELGEALRSTPAHTTLSIADASSASFVDAEILEADRVRRIYGGPKRVEVESGNHLAALSVRATHDGYLARFGFRHTRVWELAEDGAVVHGQDHLVGSGRKAKGVARDYALRFHLHPSVQLALGEDRLGARLDLPGGESWYFTAGGLLLAAEPSVYLGAPNGMQRSEQIVVRANTAEHLAVEWTLQRYPETAETAQDTSGDHTTV